MSKEKVERYKQEKANRYNTLKKEKRKKLLTKVCIWVVAIAIIGGIGTAIGVTVYNKYETYVASLPDYTATQKVIDDKAGILETETDEGESEAAKEDSTKETKTEPQTEADNASQEQTQ